MNTADAAGKVARGVALLDERKPGWDKNIDLDELRMHDGCLCILGQVYGAYLNGCRSLFRIGDPHFDAIGHGFNAPGPTDGVSDEEWEAALALLDAEWRRVITERRELVPA